MKNFVKEVIAIFIAIFFACLAAERSEVEGAQKKKEAVDSILEELGTPEGLYIKPGFLLDAVTFALPFGVNVAVKLLNTFGVFSKSS